MSELNKKYSPCTKSINDKYKCVFIPGIFSYRPFNYQTNPLYWGLEEDVNDFAKNSNYIFTNVGLGESPHDASCRVFAQIRGGYPDFDGKLGDAYEAGETCELPHSKIHGHPRYGEYFYPSEINNWNSDSPIILIGHSHGALVAHDLMNKLATDFWGLGTDSSYVYSVICVNGAKNGTSLIDILGITFTEDQTILPLWIQVLYRILLFIVAVLRYFSISSFFVDLTRPYVFPDFWSNVSYAKSLFSGKDNIIWFLSFEGSKQFQRDVIKAHKTTFYMNFSTNMNWKQFLPYPIMNPLFLFFTLTSFAMYLYGTPKKYKNIKIKNIYHRMNDGALTMASQAYFYLNGVCKYPNREFTMIDLHKQYALLKFKKENVDVSKDLFKEGIFYYTFYEPDNPIYHHLRMTIGSNLLPINDIFYRSITDFVRQRARHNELTRLFIAEREIKALEEAKFLLQEQRANETNNCVKFIKNAIVNYTVGARDFILDAQNSREQINTTLAYYHTSKVFLKDIPPELQTIFNEYNKSLVSKEEEERKKIRIVDQLETDMFTEISNLIKAAPESYDTVATLNEIIEEKRS